MNNFKNQVDEKIKMYSKKQYFDGYIQNEFLTTNGVADIFLKLDEKSQLFDLRTVKNQIDLDKEVYTFIEDKTSLLDNNIQINLHIIGIDLNSKDQEMVRHILKEHYAVELYKMQKEYIRYRNKIVKLIITGIICLFSYAFLYFHTNFSFFLEVLGFLFSFALWEAFDCYIYTFSDIKYERNAIAQDLLINIDFYDNEKNITNIDTL